MDDARAVLHSLPLFRFLPPELRQRVVDCFAPVSAAFGAVLVREGEDADAFFVLAAGKARVVKTGADGAEISVNVLGPGDAFGEAALLDQARRTATVRASSRVELYRLGRADFTDLVGAHPDIRHYLELQIRHRSLYNFFRLYSAFARLPVEALRTLVAGLEPIAVEAGGLVIREGDEAGPMFVVEEGRLRVFTETDGSRRYLSYLRKGDFFGELSLFRASRRAASVEAVSPCRLLRLAPPTFAQLLDGYPQFRAEIRERVAQYDYRQIARVPLDFAQEQLPAAAVSPAAVGPEQLSLGPAPSLPRARPRRRLWFPFVYQVDEMDCGAACLAMVCRSLGRNVSLARIRRSVQTATDGTSLKSLYRAGHELGLDAHAVRHAPEDVAQLTLPAIIHWEGNHWVVLYAVSPSQVRIADPALGRRRVRRDELGRKWSGYAAVYAPTPAFLEAPPEPPAFSWLVPFMRPFAGRLAAAVGMGILAGVLQAVPPAFLQPFVDELLRSHDVSSLAAIAVRLAAVLLALASVTLGQRYLLSRFASDLEMVTLDAVTGRLLKLPLPYFYARRSGDLQRRLAATGPIREFLLRSVTGALSAAARLATAVALMAGYSSKVALAFLLTLPVYGVLIALSRSWLRPVLQTLEESLSKLQALQLDAVRGIEAVKAMGAEGAVRAELARETQVVAARQRRADFTRLAYETALPLVTIGAFLAILWVGAAQVMDGSFTLGGLVAGAALAVVANSAVGSLLPLWDGPQSVAVLFNRLHDSFVHEPEQPAEAGKPVPVPSLEGRVRCQRLGFRYGGAEAPAILQGITFDVAAGQRVAIVGRSGAGKTTLVKCLAALLPPSEGAVCYDGVGQRLLDLSELRRQIGLVPQDGYLFNETLAHNIGGGDATPVMEQVIHAARMAGVHTFIEQLPLGYATRVGETGIALAAGQRQRVLLARALYRRPAILILDEATTAFDPEAERELWENLRPVLEETTCFVVPSRLAGARDADLILVLEKGRLVEQGTHEELLQLQGLYYYLYSQQFEQGGG